MKPIYRESFVYLVRYSELLRDYRRTDRRGAKRDCDIVRPTDSIGEYRDLFSGDRFDRDPSFAALHVEELVEEDNDEPSIIGEALRG